MISIGLLHDQAISINKINCKLRDNLSSEAMKEKHENSYII